MTEHDDLDIQLHVPEKGDYSGERSTFRILMDPEVHAGIEKYAASDMTKELGGILLGRPLEDGGHRYIVVEGYIIARYTDARQASLTFTHESWQQMHKDREREYPGLKVVGWFHTHPNFGIFLSSYDMFIQKGFFDLPWQLAYVVDPVRKTRGFFRWEGAEVVKAEYRLTTVPDVQPAQAGKEETAATAPSRQSAGWLPKAAVITAAALCCAAGVFYWQANSLNTAAEQKMAQGKEQTPPRVESSQPNPPAEGKYLTMEYRVREGDTLSGICWSLEGDVSRVNEIAAANGITDPNKLNAGSILRIAPVKRVK